MLDNTNYDEVKAARAAQAAYKRAWNRKHPEKNREYAKRYWAKKAAEMKLIVTDEREVGNHG